MTLTFQQSFDLGDSDAPVPLSSAKASRTGAFTDNMKLGVHRWFRYSAGFSAEWVEGLIRSEPGPGGHFFDPFAGSGTSLLAAQSAGVPSSGAEPHPFVFKIAAAKLGWAVDVDALRARAETVLQLASKDEASHDVASPLLLKCYSEPALQELDALRRAFVLQQQDDAISKLIWLAITAILRECSGVGTAQWQYVLPKKTKAKVSSPFHAFRFRIDMFCLDITNRRSQLPNPVLTDIRTDDARALTSFTDLSGKVSLVVTSPPYPNNYDYADATRLEMTFWREIEGWSDLQGTVRNKLIRSCSQHSAAERLQLDELLRTDWIEPIRGELTEVCQALAEVRETKGGKKTYHTMVAAYFNDLAQTFHALRSLCAPNAKVCFVIGDSAPYGVHVPADRWLASLATATGFHSMRFEKIRDRNLKWKNRKHRVPLQEGNLWMRA